MDNGFERSGRWPSKSTGGGFQEPTFLAYAAAVLEDEGLDVELIDCRPFYLDVGYLREKIDARVGLVVLQTSTPTIEDDIETAGALKAGNPGLKVALVGPHVTIFDEEILRARPEIDFVARGEYDYTIRDLALCLKTGGDLSSIEGLSFRRNGGVVRNKARPLIEELDLLPFPAHHFLPVEKYYEPLFIGRPALRLITSRGCPYKCTFCAWPEVMYGRRVRTRSPLNVADEIEFLKKRYGIKQFYFDDDTFIIDKRRVGAICDEIMRRGIKLPWDCLGRVDTVDLNLLQKMAKAGCAMIRYGVETSSQPILDNCKKGIKTEQVAQAFRLTRQAGIRSHATVMFGLPGESPASIEATIEFILKLNPDYVQFSIATPYPGTEFYQEAAGKGWLIAKRWSDFDPVSNAVVQYPGLGKREIESAIRTAYRRFYLRPSYMAKRLIKVRSLAELRNLLLSFKNLVVNMCLRSR